ncbi:ABC transporter permease [Lichenihabitans psoromatis]|uniref:ABC transporter permease n=1 Tax=Lichenihabitans psoromatis TaxID=2528642 RepID=UPI0010383CEA|nr:ABC transporter permease [Lichenihabitans psoromatis]
MTAPWVDRAVKRPEAAPIAFLVVVSLLLGLTTPGFWSSANLLNIISQVAVVGIVSLALNQVILSGEIDVSIGSLLAACAFTYASVGHLMANPVLPLLAALGVGLGVGALNGAIVTVGRVPSIIATLGMLLALRGVVLLIGANGVLLVPEGIRAFGLGSIAGLRAPIVGLVLVFVLFDLVNRNTEWGRDILAVGSNRRAADAVGLRAGFVKFRCFLATGLGCGLASAIFAGQIGEIQATAATGFELQCIAAVVLGGTSITGGRGSTLAPVIGAVLVGVILNALTLNSVPGTFEQLVLGLLILLAISVDALRFRASRRLS